jgi:hypothetical protein
MPNARSYARSFAGGEVTPEFFARFDDLKNQTGLKTCRNAIVKPHGPVSNRGGLRYVAHTKSDGVARLLRFVYSSDQSVAVEMGAYYFRFHTLGATLLASIGGPAYEVAHPYSAADLPQVKYVQSNDVMTLVHPNYPPAELRRHSAIDWEYVVISFVSTLAAPTGVGAVATPAVTSPGTPTTQSYVVTSVKGADESASSSVATCSNNLFDVGAYNTISWTAATGAERYYVYKLENGLYGYLGQTTAVTFTDDNIAPDLSKTPLIASDPFSGAGNYPGAVGYFEQRRFFAGTLNEPAYFWGTRSGTETNLGYSIPGRADDSIRVRIAARERCEIRHIVPLQNFILLTESMEWRVAPAGGDALTPDVSVRPQSGIGCNHVAPAIVNNNILFSAASGGHLCELGFSLNAGGYVTGDLCLRAPHLFDGLSIKDMAYAKSPVSVVWCTSSGGKLLGLTYVPDQEVGAWHQHDTSGGSFEYICAVPENGADVLYATVNRGSMGRFVERMEPRQTTDSELGFFVDCGLSYQGAPATVISGLSHLSGQPIVIIADGGVVDGVSIVAGAITLPDPASTVHVGLRVTCDVETPPAAFMTQGYGQGRPKNVNRVWLRLYKSRAIKIGPSFAALREYTPRTTEPFDSPPALITGEIGLSLTPTWSADGGVCIRHDDPLPFTLLSVTPEHAIGG